LEFSLQAAKPAFIETWGNCLTNLGMLAMDPDRPMYRWRQMPDDERRRVLEYRRRNSLPWHSPPHYCSETDTYLITAACYEHKPVIGHSPDRLASFERELWEEAHKVAEVVFAWIILPNHYHLLVRSSDVKRLLASFGQLHGRTSYRWNGEEGRRGRKVWFNAAETGIKSDGHFFASLNYVLHNAVHHGYVTQWQDWPYSNAVAYLEDVGRTEAERRWRKYPVLDYGKTWDPPEL
jgi:putative transposase